MFEVTEKDRIERITKYAKKFDLYDELGNIIESYSHGMKQKLVLISAFVHEPKLYILSPPKLFKALTCPFAKSTTCIKSLLHVPSSVS